MKRILAALLLFTMLWATTAEAANYAGTSVVWQVMPSATAANVNGAGFDPANANFPTDGVIGGGTGSSSTVTPTSTYSFVAGDVNAWVFVPVQTNVTYATWCPIASVAGGAATLNSAIGACVQIVSGKYTTNTAAGISTAATPTLTYGVDYSQTTTAHFTNSVLACTTTTCTDATSPFGANAVGNFIHITSGGGTVGWYEIVSVSSATATLDRSAGASVVSGTYYLGGAASLGSVTANQTDLNFFSQGASTTTSAPIWWIQGGSSVSYSMGQTVTTIAGNLSWPVQIAGFAVTRGDAPTGATRPTLAMTTFIMTGAAYDVFENLQLTGTALEVMSLPSSNTLISDYLLNNSTTTTRSGAYLSISGGYYQIINSELVSERGYAVQEQGTAIALYDGDYIHDSTRGILVGGSETIVNCVFSGNTTADVYVANAISGIIIANNTFYGASGQLGIGIDMLNTATPGTAVLNNIFNNLATATYIAAAQNSITSNYNNYYNNATNYTNWNAGANDNTTNPSFTSVSAVTGTTATSATTVLTDSGKNFTTAGVVAGRDFVDVTSGTGQTNGIYGITAVGTTTITLDNTIGTNSSNDLTYNITTGRNWNQTGLAQTTGFPQLYPLSNKTGKTNGNMTIGASQYVNAGGGGAAAFAWAR